MGSFVSSVLDWLQAWGHVLFSLLALVVAVSAKYGRDRRYLARWEAYEQARDTATRMNALPGVQYKIDPFPPRHVVFKRLEPGLPPEPDWDYAPAKRNGKR